MILLDASVLIAHLAIEDRHSARAFEILDTDQDLAIHAYNLAETLVRPARHRSEIETRSRIEAIGIEQYVSPPDEPVVLARLRADTGLKLPDCCALAAAVSLGAALATFDERLAQVARGRGVDVISADVDPAADR